MEKESKYKYSENEEEILKAFKMQENDLASLAKESAEQSDEIDDIRKRVEKLALRLEVKSPVSDSQNNNESESMHISIDDIPAWDSVVSRANSEITEEVVFEDLLSTEEFQYCIDDVRRINEEFDKLTGLNKLDASFIVVATALQTARWLLIQHFMGGWGACIDKDSRLAHNDYKIKEEILQENKGFQDKYMKHGHHKSDKGYRSWENIIFGSVPYDATIGANDKYGIPMQGKYHRYKTLGHDPILGWIFGTANIITNTITLSNFESYRVLSGLRFGDPTNLITVFFETYDSTKEDWLRLPAAVFAQYVHLKSDAFTKQGLPIPLLEAFSENLAGKLYKSQYDSLCLLRDVKIVGEQAVLSIIINMIIGLVHGLFYDKVKDGSRDLYEVRTRKILSISNLLASAGNITYSVISEDWKKLDLGGIFITMSRLFSDGRYITRLKEKFIQEKLDKLIENEMNEINSYFQT